MNSGFCAFWTQIMSGSDNVTPAIGRYLGLLLFVIFLALVPIGLLIAQHFGWVHTLTTTTILTALAVYVPSIVGSCAVLIRVTNATEPKGPNNG